MNTKNSNKVSNKKKNILDTKGVLYIVGTPIGNLKDITLRAIDTLNYVDIILAEDTRNTLKLLTHFNISKPIISYHRHNEEKKLEEVVKLLDEGKNIALVSDAGMPIISDPGKPLIIFLNKNGYKCEVIPGVTAITTAAVVTSLDTSRFSFEGFLSIKKKQRKLRLEEIKKDVRTLIFYEAPHKLLHTLSDMYEVFGNRNITIARELTKIYEECINTNILDAIKTIQDNGIKGEIVLLIEGYIKSEEDCASENEKIDIEVELKNYISKGFTKKDAIKEVADKYNLNKNEVYKISLKV